MNHARIFAAVVALAVPLSALAQDFEMDLSDAKPQVDRAFKPSIALLGVTGDGDEVALGRARLLEAEIVRQLAQSEDFQSVLDPALAARTLGAEAPALLQCDDYNCFDSVAKKLNVHRALRVVVSKSAGGSLVTAWGYDPALSGLFTEREDSPDKIEKAFVGFGGKSQAQRDRDFIKRIGPFIKSTLAKLATPNGKLVIDNIDPSTQVSIDGAPAGQGSFELAVARGTKTVKVVGDAYLPFEQQVKVTPGEVATVKVSLIARPVEVVQTEKPRPPPGPPLFSRPGTWLALGGLVATGTGIALGQVATAVSTRINAGGDPLNVTRAEAKAASTQAMLANILVGIGAAAIVGGAVWVIVTPAVAVRRSLEPTDSAVSGATLEFGGRF